MNRALATSLLVIVFVSGCQSMGRSSEAKHHHEASADMEQAVKQAGKEYTNALLQKDIGTLDRLWADDLIFVNPAGQVLSKAERLENLRSGSTTFKSIEMTEEQVRSYGNAFVHVSRGKLVANYSGKDSSGDYRITLLWTHHGDDWTIHGIQMTPIRE